MEEFYINNTSQNGSSKYGNNDDDYYEKVYLIKNVVTCIIISIGLPLTLVAIYALYSQVRNDQVAPIYVINLLISDLLQLCCMIVEVAQPKDQMILIIFFHSYCLYVSVGFMMCVALERYLVIAHPLWYRFRRTSKTSVVVCVVVWVLPLVPFLINTVVDYPQVFVVLPLLFLLPFPLFIFFLGGTLKALSASRLPSDEKRRIVGIVVLVLLIYTLLFLPSIILTLDTHVNKENLFNLFLPSDIRILDRHGRNFTPDNLSFLFVKFSPLADLVLYFFMRKGAIDKLLVSVCCCRMDSSDVDIPTL